MTTAPIHSLIETVLPEVLALRHDLHQHPELAYEEVRTAAKVVDFLNHLDGVDIQTGIAGTGLVVTIGKDLAGPCVALRADMDALPIEEESGVEWRSKVSGKMHACGHDGHTAMLAGAARIIWEKRDQLRGPVKFIFQPAEEGGAGAKKMCEEGVLKNPDVAAIFGLHNNLPNPDMPFGQIAYSNGPEMAATGIFEIEVIGVGGHAAFPHRCIDPVYIGACIIEQLQGLVSRSVDPVKPAVVSVTCFEAGTAHNIIPGKAMLKGTFRALEEEVLKQLETGIIRRATEVAQAHGAEVRIHCETGYPVLVNDPRATAVFLTVLEETGDMGSLVEVEPNMGGEDFAFFGLEVPSFFYFLPSCPVGKTDNPVCHHPAFDFNDELLPFGIRLHVETALRFARLWKA